MRKRSSGDLPNYIILNNRGRERPSCSPLLMPLCQKGAGPGDLGHGPAAGRIRWREDARKRFVIGKNMCTGIHDKTLHIRYIHRYAVLYRSRSGLRSRSGAGTSGHQRRRRRQRRSTAAATAPTVARQAWVTTARRVVPRLLAVTMAEALAMQTRSAPQRLTAR